MRSSDGQMFVFATLFALSAAITGTEAPVLARRLNSSTVRSAQENTKRQIDKSKERARVVNPCDPSRQEQTDLSGNYVGKVDYPGAGLSGDATLTIAGSRFTLTVGSFTQSGQITAQAFCGQTTATMVFGDVTQRPGHKPPPALRPVLLSVLKHDDSFILLADSGEARSFWFSQWKELGAAQAASNRPPKERPMSASGNLPQLRITQFPWPPPSASASVVIPSARLSIANTQPTLGMVAQRLQRILDQAGYDEMSWYEVPGGFALVSRFEQFDDNGKPLAGAARFLPDLFRPPIVGVVGYLTSLILPRKGHFRVIVFVVSSYRFNQSRIPVSSEAAKAWLSGGANGLPGEIARMQFTADHLATALIYEFEQASADSPATLKRPGSLTAMAHLQRCQIWQALMSQ